MLILVHSTRASGLTMAAAMDHVIDGPPGTAATRGELRGPRSPARDRRPGARRAACASSSSSPTAGRASARRRRSRDQVAAALAEARHTGWDGLLAEQRAYLDDFWDRADVEIDGDAELQQAVRFALFHTLQAGARAEQRAIAAKGLTGPGYDGHTFWDTETFVLPVLTYTAPHAARDALRWRHRTLELARERARLARAEGRRVSVADDPRTGVLGLLAGGDGGVPHQRRHRRRRRPLPGGQRRRGVRDAASASSCSSRPRGCGARSATTTPPGASGSTASPVPTSTARSPTTTSTRT